MKKIPLFLLLLLPAMAIQAQNEINAAWDMTEHKIVIQLTSADTTLHKMLMKQLNNVLVASPKSKLRVVCHGPGIDMITAKKTIVADKLVEMQTKGVQFMACENTLREWKLTKADIIAEAGFVKVGIIDIVQKQEEGWSYLRASQ